MLGTKISFVRHGQVDNPQGIYYGRLPRYRLSALGRQQAYAAAQVLQEIRASAIFSSPLLRTRQTAEIIASPHAPLRVKISARLVEVYSPFDGCPAIELIQRNWDVYAGTQSPYEQPLDVLNRAKAFAFSITKQYPQQHVIAVTHGDLIAFLALWAAGRPITNDEKQKNYPTPGSISTFTFGGSSPSQPDYVYVQP
jgi:broad specificity phosphatase PhoE